MCRRPSLLLSLSHTFLHTHRTPNHFAECVLPNQNARLDKCLCFDINSNTFSRRVLFSDVSFSPPGTFLFYFFLYFFCFGAAKCASPVSTPLIVPATPTIVPAPAESGAQSRQCSRAAAFDATLLLQATFILPASHTRRPTLFSTRLPLLPLVTFTPQHVCADELSALRWRPASG